MEKLLRLYLTRNQSLFFTKSVLSNHQSQEAVLTLEQANSSTITFNGSVVLLMCLIEGHSREWTRKLLLNEVTVHELFVN